MSRLSLLLLSLCTLCACSPAADPVLAGIAPAAEPSPPLPAAAPLPPGPRWQGYEGWDFATPLDVLMSQGARLHDEAASLEPSACLYLQLPSVGRDALSLMVENGRFVRYDVYGPGLLAPGGGAVGMTRAQLQMRYPDQTSVSPNKYLRGVLDLRVTPPSGQDHGLVFVIGADGFVQQWRLGLVPQVDYAEGCG